MKRKNLNINEIKFLMERMDKRLTFNETHNKIKNIINEGIGDEIIKAAKRSAGSTDLAKYSNEIKVLEKQSDNINNTINNFDNAFTKIQSASNLRTALTELPSASSLRVSTKQFVSSFSDLIRKISLEKGFDIKIGTIENYLNGLRQSYPTELLDVLSPENLAQLQIAKNGIKELNLINLHLEKLNKIVDTWGLVGGQSKTTKNAFISLIGKDGVESIDELKNSFKELDGLENLDFELAKDLNDSWLRIKEDLGLDTKNLDIEIQKAFRDNPSYKIVESSFKNKLNKLVNRNIENVDISLEKIKNKNLDWGKTIIYRNPNSEEIFLIQFKNQKDLDAYKNYLKRKGLDFSDGESLDEAIKQIKELATANNRIRKIKFWIYSIGGGGALLYTVICPLFKESWITPEQIEKRKEEFGEDAAVEEETYFTKMGRCLAGPLKAIINYIESLTDTMQDNVKGLGDDMLIKICEELEKICPNWECCHKDDCGEKQKECCMECNDETKVEQIEEKLKGKFTELIEKVEIVEFIIDELGEGGEDLVKNSIKEEGKLPGILFKDGKPRSIKGLIKLTCTQQNVKCVADRVNNIFGYVTNAFNTRNCETLNQNNDIPVKLQELRKFNDAGYLTLNNDEKGKVYINWQEVNPALYGSANSVEECINIMQNTYTKVILEYCKMEFEDEGEVAFERSDYESWCQENGKDSSVVKSLMEYLWKEEVVQLECTTGEDGIQYMFRPNPERKTMTSYQIWDLFNEQFKSVFPQIDNFTTDWDDAFNYWYDKQKNLCNF
jgi:hypothetical protein